MIWNNLGYELMILPRRFWHSKPSEIKYIFFTGEVELVQNNFINLFVVYEGNKAEKLIGRITKNEILNTWAIDALGSHGGQVALRINKINT